MTVPINVRGLHHFAYRCRDAEETRAFYEDLLGLPLAHALTADHVPSTGAYQPYLHIFFQMRDGSYLAFFDFGDGVASDPSPNTPDWVNHIAFEVDTTDDLGEWKERLEAAGLEVIGPIDHTFIHSIYFFDPNGVRLELTTRTASAKFLRDGQLKARDLLDAWVAETAAARDKATVEA